MIATGCSTHKTGAKACPTCHRISIEADIVTRTVDALLRAGKDGYELNVENGGEGPELPAFTTDRKAILQVLMDTDEDYLLARIPGAVKVSYVYFVYGNDGWDVISDYSVDLEGALAPINQYADELINGVRE